MTEARVIQALCMSGLGGRTVRACRSAAVGVVAERVHMHAALGIGVVAGDVEGDGGGAGLGVLLEGHGALDVGVTTENCDCLAMSSAQDLGHCVEQSVSKRDMTRK